jgi:N-acetylglucosaminyldiphosphoundecaprenol N-acetyl-beta-D-mannosaminyltransferase
MNQDSNPAVNILGVDIVPLRFDEAVRTILGWMEQGESGRFVVTPNVNHLVLYQENEPFRAAYQEASLVLADGRYVILMSRLLGRPLPEPVNGSDLVPALMAAASERGGMSVYLLGAMPGVAEKASDKIESQWPDVRVVGTYSPPPGFENDPEEVASIIGRIAPLAPDLLVVGVSPPRQEIWASRYAHQTRAAVTICAGATIDFLAEVKPRAPTWMQKAGLEWVFRAFSEPRRLVPRYTRDGIAVLRLLSREFLRSRSS